MVSNMNKNKSYIDITIIVEGKTDKNKLLSLYNFKNIICTHGTQIKQNFYQNISNLKDDKIYILTDPDYAGKKIRNKIKNRVNKTFIDLYLNNTILKKGKNGLAEANKEDIKNIFKNINKNNMTFYGNKSITWEEYIKSDSCFNKKIRSKVCKYLNINMLNNKSFFKCLINYNININNLIEIENKCKK